MEKKKILFVCDVKVTIINFFLTFFERRKNVVSNFFRRERMLPTTFSQGKVG